MLHRYELLAISDNLTELGIKRIRRVGHHTEFETDKGVCERRRLPHDKLESKRPEARTYGKCLSRRAFPANL